MRGAIVPESNSFTWSKLFENTSWTGPEIAGRNVEHKLGNEDRPFHLSIAPIWQIPIGRNRALGKSMAKVADAIVGGWELSEPGQVVGHFPVPAVPGQDGGDYPTRWGNVRASRTNNLEMGIYKNFVIREHLRAQFRFESYNTFNHARFGAPNSDPTSSNFGVVGPSQQNAPRTIQMALKVSF